MIVSQHFAQPKSSLPHSQELSTLSQPWARTIQSTPPYHFSQRYILILSTHLPFGLPTYLFPAGFPINIQYAYSPHSCYMTCPSRPPWFDHSNRTLRRVQTRRSSLCSSLHPPVLHPSSVHILPGTLSLCSSLNVRGKLLCQYNTGKV
jgi:hypothetical protein